MRALIATLAASVTLLGCAPSTTAVFTSVADDAARRTGHRLDWRPEDAQEGLPGVDLARELSSGLTIEGAVRLALRNAPALQVELEQLASAQGASSQAVAPTNPELHGSVLFHGEGHGTPGVHLDVTMDVLSFVMQATSRRGADAGLEVSRVRALSAFVRLVAEVRLAMLDLLTAERVLEKRTAIVELTSTTADLSSRMRVVGNNTLAEDLNHRAVALQARLDGEAAQAVVLRARLVAERLIGLTGEATFWKTRGEVVTPQGAPGVTRSAGAFERQVVSRSLSLDERRAEVQLAAANVDRTQLHRFLPQLGLGVAVEREADAEMELGPAFSLTLPIFNLGSGAVDASAAQLRRSQQALTAAAIELRAEARRLWVEAEVSRRRFEATRDELVPLRSAALEEAQKAYNGMLIGAFALVDMKVAALSADIALSEALRDAAAAEVRVEAARQGLVLRQDGAASHPGAAETSNPSSSGAGH